MRTRAQAGEASAVLAVHEIPAESTTVDDAGALAAWNESHAAKDPIAGEFFGTPEFDASSAAAELENEELVRK